MFAFAPISVPFIDLEIGFRFRKKFAGNAFWDRFHVCIVIAELVVNLSDLQDKKFEVISQIFSQHQWQYFTSPSTHPFTNLVQEFYANMETQLDTDEDVDESLWLVSFVRGVHIVVTHAVIAIVIQIIN